MPKVLKISGSAKLSIIIGSTICVACLVGGLVFDYKNNKLVLAQTTPTNSNSLTENQISVITSLLQSFGANAATVNGVQDILSGNFTAGVTIVSVLPITSLTEAHISAVISLIQSFGASEDMVSALRNFLATETAPSFSDAPAIEILYPVYNTMLMVGNRMPIQWRGSGLPTNDEVSIYLGDTQFNAICSFGRFLASAGAYTLVIPSTCSDDKGGAHNIPTGMYSIIISSISTGAKNGEVFSIIELSKTLGTISISPSSGPIGTQINVTGTGFDMDSMNIIHFMNSNGISESSFSLPFNQTGSYSIIVPSSTKTGLHEDGITVKTEPTVPGIYKISLSNNKGKSNVVNFTVTASQPQPQTNQPQTTCDSIATSIVNAAGGCSKINQSLYSNVYSACCSQTITKDSLLALLNNALADGVINDSEKSSLLVALNTYLGQ